MSRSSLYSVVRGDDICRDEAPSSKKARPNPEPSTPDNLSYRKGSRISAGVHGSLIHISKSADGKLRWLPPSSSTSSSQNEESHVTRRSSITTTSSSLTVVAGFEKAVQDSRKVSSCENYRDGENYEYSEVGPSSPSLASCSHGRVRSVSSEMVEDSEGHQTVVGPQHPATSVSEISVSSDQESALAATRRRTISVNGLTPYLSSKLKPGKHVLGVRKNQVFIRPGQLRHWAVGNSPALASNNVVAQSSASAKGKACRTLTF